MRSDEEKFGVAAPKSFDDGCSEREEGLAEEDVESIGGGDLDGEAEREVVHFDLKVGDHPESFGADTVGVLVANAAFGEGGCPQALPEGFTDRDKGAARVEDGFGGEAVIEGNRDGSKREDVSYVVGLVMF